MILPDVNLLLYAYDGASPFHVAAKRWWRECLDGHEVVLLPEVVVFGFVRVGTNARAFHHPLTPAEAASHVRSWLGQPVVRAPEAMPDHCERVLSLLEQLGTAGNLVTDAQIAATAISNGAVLHTADADFMRFPGLRWLNPLTNDRPPRRRRGQ
ncbi:MAG: TA system VapC family ribonuclease toxin [Polyangia bacterium]|jgi:toxin-antitoxin system PIN domain toxin